MECGPKRIEENVIASQYKTVANVLSSSLHCFTPIHIVNRITTNSITSKSAKSMYNTDFPLVEMHGAIVGNGDDGNSNVERSIFKTTEQGITIENDNSMT